MNLKQLLENRHTARLQWFEPRIGIGADNNVEAAHVMVIATVHDCVNMARYVTKDHRGMSDENLLGQFIAIHWAKVEE